MATTRQGRRSKSSIQKLLLSIAQERERFKLHESGDDFMMVNLNTFWTQLFFHHFVDSHEPDEDFRDDMLFFVKKTENALRNVKTEIEVFRKYSKQLPSLGDTDVDWEETVYLNLILQQFDYTLTCAVCTRTSAKDLQILKRFSQRVYASPSKRSMDSKGEEEQITYPSIFFMVDNFDEIFTDIVVRDGEMVCVELVASDKGGSFQGVIFLGSIRYDALQKVYNARASISSRMAQRITLGWYRGQQKRVEFVRMKGPQGKGHAEMAVSKEKSSVTVSCPTTPDEDNWDTEFTFENEVTNTRIQNLNKGPPRAKLISGKASNSGRTSVVSPSVHSQKCSQKGDKCHIIQPQLSHRGRDVNPILPYIHHQHCDHRPANWHKLNGAATSELRNHQTKNPCQVLLANGCETTRSSRHCLSLPQHDKSETHVTAVSHLRHRDTTCENHATADACNQNCLPPSHSHRKNALLTATRPTARFYHGIRVIDSSHCDGAHIEESSYDHRRMSDPSANLKSYVKGFSRHSNLKKALSNSTENIDVDVTSEGWHEVEAGDLLDEFAQDSIYNKVWEKGLSQAWYWLKERRRASCVALNAFTTYVSVPCNTIIEDLLEIKQQPVLTF